MQMIIANVFYNNKYKNIYIVSNYNNNNNKTISIMRRLVVNP